MTLLVEKGTFTKTTSTSTPVDQTVTLSNGSLTPKLVILWTDGQTTNDGTYVDDARISYGFSDGTNDACQALRSDESAELESYVFHDNAVISIINLTTNAIVSQGDISSFGAGNFHINWSVQSDTSAMVIHYIVAGGTDITNVSCVATTVGDTLTGNHSYNGSGTTFIPDFALTMTGPDGFTTNNTLVSSTDQGLFCIGAAKSTSKRWVMWGRVETAATSDTDMFIHNGGCLAACSNTTGASTFVADFVSFNSAAGGGITVNITDGADASTKKLAFLFVKGASWDCGTFQQRSGTGTQDVTIATGIDPAIVFLGGINSATASTPQTNNYIGIGASDGTNEGATYFGSANAVGTWTDVNSNLNTKVYRISTPNATASSSTTNAECDMTGMSTAGQFTLDWTTADTTLRQMAYWVLGVVSSTAYERALATETVSTSETLDRVYGGVRALSTETTSSSESIATMLAATRSLPETTAISENLARTLDASRALSTETISISEDLQRIRGQNRTLDETTAVSESLDRQLAATRTIQEDTTIGESLTRLLSAMRTLVETTAISESIVAVREYLRAITETVDISESLTRLLAATRTITENTGIVEDLQRLLAATRTITENTAINESLQKVYGAVRLLSTETVTIGESLTRQLAATRELIETTVVSEGLVRLLAAVRTLSTETISIAENLAHQFTSGSAGNYVRSLVETILISESLQTLASFLGKRPEDTGSKQAEGQGFHRKTPNWWRHPWYLPQRIRKTRIGGKEGTK